MISDELFSGIFKNKIVFITGHTGFIGSWLSLWLHFLGAKVIGYSLPPPTNPSMFEIVGLDKHVTSVMGNVCDSDNLMSVMTAHKPELVIHLAAQPLVLAGYQKPVETFETNVMGTINLLEAIRNIKSVRVCINFTSDKCYENLERNYAYKETDSLGGYDPYSASKASSELITSSYTRSFFNDAKKSNVGIATIRAGNVIGGGDWAENRLIPTSISDLETGRKIRVRNPESTRPWQHVLEPLSGILWLITKMLKKPENYNGSWNIGPSEFSISVKELVEQIIAEWGNGSWEQVSMNSNPSHEAGLLKLDCNKAKDLLGWNNVYSIREAIFETVSWYQSYYKKTNMNDFTKMQIENYVNRAKEMKAPWAQ